MNEARSAGHQAPTAFLAEVLIQEYAPCRTWRRAYKPDMDLIPNVRSLRYAQAHLAEIISTVNSTRQSMVVTRRGVRVAVIQDFDSYRRTEDALLMLKLVAMGEADIAKGRSRSSADVFRSLRRRLKARSAAQSKASKRK